MVEGSIDVGVVYRAPCFGDEALFGRVGAVVCGGGGEDWLEEGGDGEDCAAYGCDFWQVY